MKSTKNYVFKIFLTVFLLVTNPFYPQNNYFEEWYSADTEHLPQNSVKSIAPDKYGFIWMTTENGLVRFDGKNFKTYNSNNRDLSSNRFLYLSGSIEKDSLRTFTESYADNIIINQRTVIKTTQNYFLNSFEEYENSRFYLNNTNNLQSDFLLSKIRTKKCYYYKIEKNRIILFDNKNNKKKVIEHQHKPSDDYFLLNDELVCLSSNGDYIIFNYFISKNNKLDLNNINKKIYNHLTQQYFICTNKEIYIVKKATNKLYLSLLHKQDKPFTYDIKCLYYDIKCNKLFLGTGEKGLGIITLNKFGILTNINSANNTYYATTPFLENTFLTSKGEIFNKNGLINDLKLNQTGNQFGIAIDKNQNIWIPENSNLVCYFHRTNYKTFKKYEFKSILSTIYCDSENKIWIGFRKDDAPLVSVATINANDINSKPLFIKSLNEPINFFVELRKDKMILSSLNKKIIHYDKITQKVTKLSSGKNDIRSIFICNDNKIWVCTYSNGFSLFENNRFYKLPIDKSSYLTSAHCIMEDNEGHFWISTNKGLIEVDKKNLLNYIKEKSPVYYNHYDKKNGFLTNEFNGGCEPCNTKLKNGYFVYPSLNGLIAFNPEKVNKILPSGDFYINEVEIANRILYFKDTLKVDRKNNRIRIKIDFPYFGNEDNVYFEAKLQLNENDKWVKLADDRTITFTNLPPGNHDLLIRKLGDFSTIYKTKQITIVVPFLYYETLWFKIISSILIVFIFVIGIRLRYNYIQKKNIELESTIEERTRTLIKTINELNTTKNNLTKEINQQKKLIGTISHDIKSPLKFINIGINNLEEKSKNIDNIEIQKISNTLNNSSKSLLNFIDNLIEYSKIVLDNSLSEDDFVDADVISSEIINLYKEIAISKNNQLNYKNLSNKKILITNKISKIIIGNLVDNALKNTENGTIDITIELKSNKIFLNVTDTGKGFTDAQLNYYTTLFNNYEKTKFNFQNNGLGLYLVIELINLLNGDFRINKNNPNGSRIEIVVDSKISNY